MNYTKGEWKIRQHGVTSQIYIETPDRPRTKEYQIAEGIYNEANARLIASAPELYEALKRIIAEGTRCLDVVQQDKPVHEIYNIDEVDRIARLAIAKAEGKEK